MAVLFEQSINGHNYRVTQAGASRRLYTNGVFHSQYNERSVISGAVWDLLLLPVFFNPQPNNALVLGVGGGAVLRMLNYFFPQMTIDGVDLSGQHLTLAQQYFGVSGDAYRLHQAHAQHWLRNRSHAAISSKNFTGFDYILDDVFAGLEGDPQRPYEIDREWVALLFYHLNDGGVVAFNFDHMQVANAFIARLKKWKVLPRGYAVWRLQTVGYENCILALAPVAQSKKILQVRLCQHRLLDATKAGCKLNYSIERVNRP